MVVSVAMAVRTKFFAFFFDGVLLSQKTHELLLASVSGKGAPIAINFGYYKTYVLSICMPVVSSNTQTRCGFDPAAVESDGGSRQVIAAGLRMAAYRIAGTITHELLCHKAECEAAVSCVHVQ